MEIAPYFLLAALASVAVSLALVVYVLATWRLPNRGGALPLSLSIVLAAFSLAAYVLVLSIGAPTFSWFTFAPLVSSFVPGFLLCFRLFKRRAGRAL
jgi:hypothetical protein